MRAMLVENSLSGVCKVTETIDEDGERMIMNEFYPSPTPDITTTQITKYLEEHWRAYQADPASYDSSPLRASPFTGDNFFVVLRALRRVTWNSNIAQLFVNMANEVTRMSIADLAAMPKHLEDSEKNKYHTFLNGKINIDRPNSFLTYRHYSLSEDGGQTWKRVLAPLNGAILKKFFIRDLKDKSGLNTDALKKANLFKEIDRIFAER
jgi:hypothetical protein